MAKIHFSSLFNTYALIRMKEMINFVRDHEYFSSEQILNLELSHLRTFYEVAKTKNYTQAGKHLFVTQSAISHSIKKLEQSIGKQLIEWKAKNFRLTQEGIYLFEVCERVFQELDDAATKLENSKDNKTYQICLGATVEFGTTILLRKIKGLLNIHPQLHIDFYFSHELINPLLKGDLDIIVDCQHHNYPNIEKMCLFREEYTVIATPAFQTNHKLESPIDIQKVNSISMDKSGEWWNRLVGVLPPNQRPILHIMTINHIRGIINATLSEMGVGLVPRYTVLQELKSGLLVEPFPDLKIQEDIFCIYQKRSRTDRIQNQILTEYLTGITPEEFGENLKVF